MKLICKLLLLLSMITIFGNAETATIKYKVKRGDSLFTIARKHHTTVAKVRKANGLKKSDVLKVGMVLKMPSNGNKAKTRQKESSKKFAESLEEQQRWLRKEKTTQAKKQNQVKTTKTNKPKKIVKSSKKQQEYKKVVHKYANACDGGDVEGCSKLGLMYANGEGVKQDDFKALEFFGKACNGGFAKGCANLGFMYRKGRGEKQDDSKALEFYTKACDGGDAQGCSNLGFMHLKGEGVKQDASKAVEFYTKACDGGDAQGCSNLGLMHAKGEGVKQDDFKAVELYNKACDGGNAHGCSNLEVMYNKVRSVKRDDLNADEYIKCYVTKFNLKPVPKALGSRQTFLYKYDGEDIIMIDKKDKFGISRTYFLKNMGTNKHGHPVYEEDKGKSMMLVVTKDNEHKLEFTIIEGITNNILTTECSVEEFSQARLDAW